MMAALMRLDAALGPKVQGPKLVHIKCQIRPENLEPANTINVVSYNILSSATSSDGYYKDTNGASRTFDEDQRRRMIYSRLKEWMEKQKVICLQEVTYSFLFLDDQLQALLDAHSYDVYANFYAYSVQKQTTTMGLAVFVPINHFAEATLLSPWQYPLKSRKREAEIEEIKEEIETLHAKKIELCKAKRTTADVTALQQAITDIQTQIADLQTRQKALDAASKQEVTNYKDRTILALRLGIAGGKISIGNIHVPCQFKDPWLATSIAFQAKQAVLEWATDPLVFCGDFNSQPGQAGYRCFTGTQVSVDPDRIPADTFSRVVTEEKWESPLETFTGCTCYGLTAATVEAKVFEPRPFHLDHFFVRDPDSLLTITRSICPTLEQVRAKTSYDPLPNLEAGEPSDHLPIELGFRHRL